MKKIICTLIICAIAAASFALTGCGQAAEDPIRIHIRANSNTAADQSVKLLVRDNVVSYLTPKLENAADKSDAYEIISGSLTKINGIAKEVLNKNGFSYGATVRLNNEYFPARSYDGVVFDSGWYDALIVELGTGEGDNWWCVAYPPLCFYGNDSVEYTSLIKEWFFS